MRLFQGTSYSLGQCVGLGALLKGAAAMDGGIGTDIHSAGKYWILILQPSDLKATSLTVRPRLPLFGLDLGFIFYFFFTLCCNCEAFLVCTCAIKSIFYIPVLSHSSGTP